MHPLLAPHALRPLVAFLLALPAPGQRDEPKPAAPTRDVCGTVDGAGGARVRVTLWHNDMRAGSVEPIAEGMTDGEGAFALRGVPWFERQEWGFHSFVLVARTDRETAAGTIRGVDATTDALRLALDDARDVSGTLTSQDQGAPLAGVQVWARILGEPRVPGCIWLMAPLPPWTAITDADGRFTIQGLPASLQPVRLIAGNADYARTEILVADPRQPVAAELPRGGIVRGVVVMPDGTPAVRVRVRATDRRAAYAETMTGDDGAFSLRGLAADVYKVWAEVPDLTVIAVLDLAIEPGTELDGQRVQLVTGGFIVGRIVDAATGAPFVPGPHTDVAMYGPARGDGGACEATAVLPDGTFRIRAPAGRNRIYLRAAGGWTEPSEYVDVVEGKETQVEWQIRKGGGGQPK